MEKKIIILILTTFLIGAIFSSCSSNEDVNKTTETVEIQKEEADKTETQIQEEKLNFMISDGIYTEEVKYTSPGGEDTFEINLEIEDEVIKKFDLVVVGELSEISVKKITGVHDELQTLAVGKKISEIDLPDIISGASLTTKALNSKLNEMNNI